MITVDINGDYIHITETQLTEGSLPQIMQILKDFKPCLIVDWEFYPYGNPRCDWEDYGRYDSEDIEPFTIKLEQWVKDNGWKYFKRRLHFELLVKKVD